MISPLPFRKLALTFSIVAALALTACSKPEPNTQANAEDPLPATQHAMDHDGMDMGESPDAMDPNMPMAQASVDVVGEFGSGKPVKVTLHITDMMSGKVMGPEAFEIAHTQKVHVLGIDPSLTDYSHSHPVPTDKAGDWTFSFTPKFNRPYHLWLDVKAIGGKQEYVMFTINEKGAAVPVEKLPALTAVVGNITASLSFDAPLVVGAPAMGHVNILRDGKPFASLEPVMGAYGHIVGISEDWETISHVHPMGTEPSKENDRGGPMVDFHLEPKHAGFLKLFTQIQVDGKDVFLPFGVTVQPAK
ncbi:MAG: hypothetical protein ABI644_14945 [Arenimonas sp.]